jgi:hypothetical protein
MPINIQRTAGPLGRAFGFSLDIGPLGVSFNAGWYVLFLVWRGFGYLHLSTHPWQCQSYRKGDL